MESKQWRGYVQKDVSKDSWVVSGRAAVGTVRSERMRNAIQETWHGVVFLSKGRSDVWAGDENVHSAGHGDRHVVR